MLKFKKTKSTVGHQSVNEEEMVELEGQHFTAIIVAKNHQWMLKVVGELLMRNRMLI